MKVSAVPDSAHPPPLILAPTARLARSIARRRAETHIGQNRTAWLRADVLPWRAWLARLLDDHLLAGEEDRVLLKPHQSAAIWSDLVDPDVILPGSRVTEMIRRSWERLHEWSLPPPERWQELELNEDSRRFRGWAVAYRKLLGRGAWMDEAMWASELPARIAGGKIALPDRVVLHGFDLPLTPLQEKILGAVRARGTAVDHHRVDREQALHAAAVEAADAEDELWRAAAWARAKLESGARRVAIVVPELETLLESTQRILRRVLAPPRARLAAVGSDPWHLSLGMPLSRWPLVADALNALRLDPDGLDVLDFGRLLRSPFFAGAEVEAGGRAALDAVLRKLPGYRVKLSRVLRVIETGRMPTPYLGARLNDWSRTRANPPKHSRPGQWARRFSGELEALGFGRGRGLDSREYQALEAWQACVEQLAGLDSVSGPVTRAKAVGRLSELAGSRVFREQNPGAPLEVVGVYEALGDDFDAVWITGMDDGSWPPPARSDPFLPRSLQAGMAETTPQGMLDHAVAVLDGLFRLAPEVIVSWPAARNDEELKPTRLLGRCANTAAALPDPGPWRSRHATAVMDEPFDDIAAPRHPGGRTRGGTRVLADQSACPFKAFAEHRLGAGELEHPRAGLNAMQRGMLLHLALEYFWARVETSDTLNAMSPDSLASLYRRCAARAVRRILAGNDLVLSASGKRLEIGRLARRLEDWTAVERARPPFRVLWTERWMDLAAGGLALKGKVDRVDELADGAILIIDYKGGKADAGSWSTHKRLEDPQLPLYALQFDPPPAALAFARLRPDQLGWSGLAAFDLGIEGIPALSGIRKGRFSDVDDWHGLLTGWGEHIEALAAEFETGAAAVDPRAEAVCRYCHLGAMCRIAERRGRMGEG